MNIRTFALLAVVTLGTSAHATFELMLIVQENRILRYDPENNIALGSFGAGQLGAYNDAVIAVNPIETNQVAVLNYDGAIRKFNFHTGAYLGAVSTGVANYFGNGPIKLEVLTNGNYLVSGYTGFEEGQVSRIISPTGALLSQMNPFGSAYTPVDSVQGADGNIYTLNRLGSSGSFQFYTFVFDSSGTYQGFNSLGSSTSASQFASIGRSGNKILVGGGAAYNVKYAPLGINQAFTNATWYSWQGANSSGDFSEAHYRTFLHDFTSSSGTFTNRLASFDPATNIIVQGQVAMPYTDELGSMTIVIAPEPGTLGAIGVGLAVLARRRKAAKNG